MRQARVSVASRFVARPRAFSARSRSISSGHSAASTKRSTLPALTLAKPSVTAAFRALPPTHQPELAYPHGRDEALVAREYLDLAVVRDEGDGLGLAAIEAPIGRQYLAVEFRHGSFPIDSWRARGLPRSCPP